MREPDRQSERYAEALLILGQAAGRVQRVADDLSRLKELFERSEELRRFSHNPLVRVEGKQAAMAEIAGAGLDNITLHVVQVLAGEDNLAALPAVADAFFGKVAHLDQMLTGELVATAPVTQERILAIEQEAGRILGLKVALRLRVNPEMGGGLRLQVGDIVIDGSLENQLDALRDRLLGG